MKPSDKLLQRFWTRILKDRKILGGDRQELVGAAGKKAWIKEIPRLALLNLKGVKVAPSKWMSLLKATSKWEPTLSSRALVLASLCMSKGWILTEEDLFAGTRLGATSFGEKPGATSKASALRDASAKLKVLKDRQQNNMVTATKLLADVDVINGIRLIFLAGKSQWTGFNRLMKDLGFQIVSVTVSLFLICSSLLVDFCFPSKQVNVESRNVEKQSLFDRRS